MVASKPPFPKFISRHFLKAGYPIQIVLQTYVPYGQRGAQRVFWAVYRTTKGEWRWTLFARNGRVLGASSEAFKRRRACLLNAGAHGCPLACALQLVRGVAKTEEMLAWDWNPPTSDSGPILNLVERVTA